MLKENKKRKYLKENIIIPGKDIVLNNERRRKGACKIQNKGFWKGCLYKLYLRSLKGFKINNTKLRRLKRENI